MRFLCVTLCLLLLLPLAAGCAPQKGDWLAPFSGGFSAEIDGSFHALPFAASVTLEPPESGGVAPGTLLFYAPASLAGTVLRRDGAGNLSLTVGELTRPAPAALGALFEVFGADRAVESVGTQGGVTTVTGEGFTLTLDSAGTPLSLSTPAIEIRILSFHPTP